MQSELKQNPFDQFSTWLDAALATDMPEPTAMNLATCDKSGVVSSRMVLLKGIDQRGFVFYTNYQSRKAADIEVNAQVALCFWWGKLERQVRIEGRIELVDGEESDEYFSSRPRGSRIGAIASRQSEVLSTYQELENRVAELEKKYDQTDSIPRPDYWGGYRVIPHQIEFWQGRPNRLHDRILYTKAGDSEWKITRLSP